MTPAFDSTEISRLLATWPVGRLAMRSAAGGGPWLVPIVFAPVGGSIWSPVDGKPKSGGPLQRLVNAEADPRASLLLDEYDQDWSRLWWVRLDGNVRVHSFDPDQPHAVAAGAIAALRAKYPQYRKFSLFTGEPTLLELAIERTRTWSATPPSRQRSHPPRDSAMIEAKDGRFEKIPMTRGSETITGWHAHVYYDTDSRPAAERLRAAVEERFDARVGRWHDRPVGPHPRGSYQIAFEPAHLGTLLPWLMLNRGALTIFVHPLTGHDLEDHGDLALWLGPPEELDRDALRPRT